jgi:hypothetical protein
MLRLLVREDRPKGWYGGLTPKAVGEITQAKVLAALVAAGKTVLVPFGDNARYDLVVEEEDGRFWRIQCKTGRLFAGTIKFPTSSSHNHYFKARRDYRGQADYFGVFCPDNQKVYIVPVEGVGRSSASLRLFPTGNKQKAGIRWAPLYEVGTSILLSR